MKAMLQLLFTLWTIMYASMLSAEPVIRQLTVANGLPNNQVRQIVELPNGQILVATEGFFSLYNGHHFVTLDCNLDSVYRLPAFGGYAYFWQGDSLLWLKDYYSLYQFDARKRKFTYNYSRQPWPRHLQDFVDEHTDTIAQDRRHYLAPYRKQLEELVSGTPLADEQLETYLRDRSGGEWYGLRYSGVLYKRPSAQLVQCIDIGMNDVARHMAPLGEHLMLIAGRWGIYEFDVRSQQVTRVLLRDEIYTYESTSDAHGRVWISTTKGLFAYEHGRLQLFDTTNVEGLTYPYVRFALPVDDRRLLICNNPHNLGYFYPEQRRFELLNTRLPQLEEYRTMIVASPLANRNHIAVCTQNGFFAIDTSADTLFYPSPISNETHYSRKYNCILHDRVGRLWVGTQNGLLVAVGDRLRRLTRADGLSNECIQSLAEDHAGSIWVGTSNGINRIRTDAQVQEVHIRTLSTDDGLPESEMTERGICLMPDGMLYLATPVGMVALPTAAFQASAEPLPVELVGLHVGDQPMSLDTLPLTLNHRQNYIELQVSALNYAHPLATHYRYRLHSLDESWHYPNTDGNLATIRYEALQPGTYTLEVQASTGDDMWGPTLRKTFVIRPPLWLTWWAKLLYAVSICAIVFILLNGYLRYRRRKLERENERRINELFELREEARHRFAQAVEIQPDHINESAEDRLMVEHIMKAIGDNMQNTEYTVDHLANDVGMSRANLYKKMQSALGITPNDFIRNVRLKRAAELLAKSDIPVNQLALMVGFQTPRYFSKCFRKMFGVTPSEYRGGETQRAERTHDK
ncbi:MAG: helix-turn-helix domain-containing protein [Bacteroidales bacterium]|nr:helix-turn-helix domain-containing protein [Bacteroidales bacterium]